MSKIACLYFEGNDSKIALFKRENDKLILEKALSLDTSLAFHEQNVALAGKSNGTKPKDVYNYNFISEETTAFNKTYLQKLNEFFLGEDLSKCKFIPILTEPAVYFQKVNDKKDLASLNINNKGKIDTTIDFVQLHNNSKLAVYPSGQSNYLQAIDSLARMNNRRFFKIPTVKSAEISLSSYIARKKKFKDDEISLILYIGKEYSKIVILRGDKLFHIGSTLSVGKNSFNAHNVIVSKILLEMEHGSLSNIENIIICGEEDSADLISIISEAYPGAMVTFQGIKSVEVKNVDSFSTEASFIVPVAVAEEYYAELDKKLTGINLLPKYIKEEQKLINLEWHGYLMILLILLSAGFFISRIYSNHDELVSKDIEIKKFQLIETQNREIVNTIKSYENKIQNVDNTKSILDQLSSGTGILTDQLRKLSDYTNQRRSLWISYLNMNEQKKLILGGYTFSRRAVKDLTDTYNGSILENIIYEPLRDTRTFKFKIDAGSLPGGVQNETKE